jgi:hypothetical protein
MISLFFPLASFQAGGRTVRENPMEIQDFPRLNLYHGVLNGTKPIFCDM